MMSDAGSSGRLPSLSMSVWGRITRVTATLATIAGASFAYLELSAGKSPMAVLLECGRVSAGVAAALIVFGAIVALLRRLQSR